MDSTDSPFLFAPPDLPQPVYSNAAADHSRPGTAYDGLSHSLPNNSLSGLALPVWPLTESSRMDHALARGDSDAVWHSGNTRPFTAPAAGSWQSGGYYGQDVVHPAGPLLSSSSNMAGSFTPANYAMPYTKTQGSMSYLSPTEQRSAGAFAVGSQFANRWRQTSLPETQQVLPDEPGQGSVSPFLYAPPSITTYQQPMAYDPYGQRRPATSGALYGGLSRIAEPSSSEVSSRPSTSSERPDTASSATSTLLGEDDGDEESRPLRPKKRPRRRFEEIERIYECNYPGCTKAYGTLNHLNAHVTMQKHGPKRMPSEFKEMRKAWKEKKKAEEAKRRDVEDEYDEEEDVEHDRSPTPPARVPPVLTQIRPFSHQQAGAAQGQQPVFAFSPAVPMPSPRDLGRPMTAPAPLLFPQPVRPATSPADAYAFLGSDVDRPPLPLTGQQPLLSLSPLGDEPPRSIFRRPSLPNASWLPTLYESPELYAGESVYS